MLQLLTRICICVSLPRPAHRDPFSRGRGFADSDHSDVPPGRPRTQQKKAVSHSRRAFGSRTWPSAWPARAPSGSCSATPWIKPSRRDGYLMRSPRAQVKGVRGAVSCSDHALTPHPLPPTPPRASAETGAGAEASSARRFWQQPDTLAAVAGAAVAIGLGLAVIGAGRKTDACAFGFPPWGNYSEGRIVCDGADCQKRESPQFDMFFDSASRSYNQTAIATLVKASKIAAMPNGPRYACKHDIKKKLLSN